MYAIVIRCATFCYAAIFPVFYWRYSQGKHATNIVIIIIVLPALEILLLKKNVLRLRADVRYNFDNLFNSVSIYLTQTAWI